MGNKKVLFHFGAGALLLSVLAAPVSADVIASSTCLPPNASGDVYAGQPLVFNVSGQIYRFANPVLSALSACRASPISVGTGVTDPFTATLSANLSINGGAPTALTGLATLSVNVVESSASGGGDGVLNGESFFNTQMTQFDTNLGSALLRIDPSIPSTGQTTITNIGGGNFQISSFFDVFTDLSLDGGATWTPATGPSVETLSSPEPGSFALLGVGLALLAARKRRRG